MLHTAAEAGNLKVITYLTSHGANIISQDIDGWTPLMKAISCHHWKAAQLIISQMSDSNLLEIFSNERKRTVFHTIARTNAQRTSDETDEDVEKVIKKLLEKASPDHLNFVDIEGNTALHYAVQQVFFLFFHSLFFSFSTLSFLFLKNY